jgi:exodeoxyribonuclease-1
MVYDIKVELRPDIIPDVMAFLTHRISPKSLYSSPSNNLFTEFEAAEKIRSIMLERKNTCVFGFNNISFDDEITRHTNFRNLLDPYEHEWKQGNHRSDVYMLLMLTRLYSESSINWHKNEDSTVSLKLEDTCKANGITHGASHDAVNDVLDTLALAKLIKDRRPELFARFKQMSDKRYIQGLLQNQRVLVSTGKFTPKAQYNTTLILPLSADSVNKNRYYGVDLTKDLSFLLNCTPDELAYEMFTKNSDKTYAPIDTGVHTVTANKIPILTTPSPRDGEPSDAGYRKVAIKAGLDYDMIKRNEELVRENFLKLKSKVLAANGSPPQEKVHDVFVSLYSGKFDSDAAKSLKQRQRLIPSNGDGKNYLMSETIVDKFRSFREDVGTHAELILRAKWNNNFRTLLNKNNIGKIDPNELIAYRDYLKKALFDSNSGLGITIDEYHAKVGEARVERDLTEDDFKIIDELNDHVKRVVALYEFIVSKCEPLQERANQLRRQRPDDYDRCFSQPFKGSTFDSINKVNEEKENNSNYSNNRY